MGASASDLQRLHLEPVGGGRSIIYICVLTVLQFDGRLFPTSLTPRPLVMFPLGQNGTV